MQARARTNKRDDWTLWDMLRIKVDNKPVLLPGKLTMKYDDKLYEAQLLKDGIIRYGLSLFYTPSGFSSHVIQEAQNKKLIKSRVKATSDGWKMVEYDGIKLEILRTKAGITTKRTKSKLQPTKEKMIERMRRLKHKENEKEEIRQSILKKASSINDNIIVTYDYVIKYNKTAQKMNKLYKTNVPAKPMPKECKHFEILWKRLQDAYGEHLTGIKTLSRTERVMNKLQNIGIRIYKDMNDSKRAKNRVTRKYAGFYRAQLIN